MRLLVFSNWDDTPNETIQSAKTVNHCPSNPIRGTNISILLKNCQTHRSAPVGAVLCVQALVGHPQAFDRAAADQMLLDDGRGIFGTDIAVPDRFRVNDDHGAMFALIQAAGLVDAHLTGQSGGLGKLLQLNE